MYHLLDLQGSAVQWSAPHISYMFFLLHPDEHCLPSGPGLFSCLPSDRLTSTHAPSNPTQHDSLQIKLCHTSFFLTLQFRIKPIRYHGMRNPVQSAFLESSPISLSSPKPHYELLFLESSPDPFSAL